MEQVQPVHGLKRLFSGYIFCAGLATVVDFGVLWMLTHWGGWWYWYAAILSYLAGMVTNFSLNKHYNFQNRSRQLGVQFSRFALVAIVGLGFNQLLLYVLVEFGGWHYLVAKVAAVGLVMFWSFFAHHWFTFRVIAPRATRSAFCGTPWIKSPRVVDGLEITIENAAGSYKSFEIENDPVWQKYPLAGVTYPVDYGYIDGYHSEDGKDLDVFVGHGDLYGYVVVWRYDVPEETKIFMRLTTDELAAVIKAFQPVIRRHHTFASLSEFFGYLKLKQVHDRGLGGELAPR